MDDQESDISYMHATLTIQLGLHQSQAGQWRSEQVRIQGQRQRSDLEINGVHVAMHGERSF